MTREYEEGIQYPIDERDTKLPSFLTLLRKDPMVLVWTAALFALARLSLWAEGCPKSSKPPKNT